MLIFGGYNNNYWILVMRMDQQVSELIQRWSNSSGDYFFLFITHFGSSYAYLIGAIIFTGILITRKRWLDTLFMNINIILTWWLMIQLKVVFARARPLGEQLISAAGFSFPSGHAMLATAFYGFLAYLAFTLLPERISKKIVPGLFILILVIGISRVYLNVHYFTDILAGFIFGGLITLFFIKLRQKAGGFIKY
ncbi:MAG: phosphatase PAP2 family protein [Syntrophomonadaceae bacterium]|jgi:undecaprenyl-diphosphatase